jgi:hypothetical protein
MLAFVGASLFIQTPPIARPQADLAVGLANIDDNGRALIQLTLPTDD